jgi:tetratricopeptide (TPR) repeat protein
MLGGLQTRDMHRPRIADVARLLQHPASAWTALYVAYFACFARTLGYGLVWDDAVLPKFAHSGATLSELLLAPQQAILDPVESARSGAVMRVDSYRPLQSLSHVIDARWLDAAPSAMHLHNLLLGAVNIALAYVVARRLDAPRPAALFASAVFALHPLQVEPIAYVSARGDLLATLFALLCLVFALWPGKSPSGAIVASAACYLLSLLAKEAYALLPLVLAAAFALDRTLRARVPLFAAHAVAAAAYLALRTTAMGRDAAQLGAGPLGAVRHAPAVLLQYVRSFVLPLDVSIARPEDPALDAPGLACMLAAAVIVGVLVYRERARSNTNRAARRAILALVWIVVLLAPSWVAVADTHVLSDRYFYLPLLGAALLCTALYAQLRGTLARKLVLAAASGWAALALLAAIRHVPDFRDNRALYTQAVLAAPRSGFAHYQLGYLEATEHEWPRAAALFARAIELDPRGVRAHDNLGVALLELHRPEQAAAVLRAAIALAPGLNYRALYNLGLAQKQLGDDAGACASFQASHRINARYALAASMLATCESRAQAVP